MSLPSPPRRRRPWLAAALVAAVALPSPASTQTTPTSSAPTPDRGELQDSLLAATEEEERLFRELRVAEDQRTRVEARLAELEVEVAAATDELGEAEARVDDRAAEASAIAAELDDRSSELAAVTEVLEDEAVGAFMAGTPAGEIDQLLQADDLRELGAVRTYADAVVEHQHGVVDRVAGLRDEVAALSTEAEQARDEAEDSRAGALAQRRRLAEGRDRIAALRNEVVEASDARRGLLAEVQARRAVYERELAVLNADSSSITALLLAYQADQEVLPPTAGTFSIPIATARLTSPFGYRTHPVFGGRRLHAGMDLSAPSGTPIHAAADGVVVAAGPNGGYGNAVVIDHGGSLATLYGHQSVVRAQVGQVVREGDVIGLVGSTGVSTGPHLHFEVRVKGTPTDPMPYL